MTKPASRSDRQDQPRAEGHIETARGDEPPEHAAIAKLAWDAALAHAASGRQETHLSTFADAQLEALIEDMRDNGESGSMCAAMLSGMLAALRHVPGGAATVKLGEPIPATVNGEPGRAAFFTKEAAEAYGFKLASRGNEAEGLREAVQAIVNRWDGDMHEYSAKVLIMQLKATLAASQNVSGTASPEIEERK